MIQFRTMRIRALLLSVLVEKGRRRQYSCLENPMDGEAW